MKKNASGVRYVFRHAQLMPYSERLNSCILSYNRNAPVAICACRPVPWIASLWNLYDGAFFLRDHLMLRPWPFNGGVHLEGHKQESNFAPLIIPPLPKTLIYPLPQLNSGNGNILVASGDRVLKGQAIVVSDNPMLPPVHAASSGWVRCIEQRPAHKPDPDKPHQHQRERRSLQPCLALLHGRAAASPF